MFVYQHQRAKNNVNGNPRRLWRVWRVGIGEYAETVAVIDEGYGNFPRDRWPGAVEIAAVDIPGPTYTRTIKMAREYGYLEYAR